MIYLVSGGCKTISGGASVSLVDVCEGSIGTTDGLYSYVQQDSSE